MREPARDKGRVEDILEADDKNAPRPGPWLCLYSPGSLVGDSHERNPRGGAED